MKSGKPAPPHYKGHGNACGLVSSTAVSESLHDYELLELLLTYAIPMQDVKPLAKDLLSRFRSFAGVLDASPNELVKVKGIWRVLGHVDPAGEGLRRVLSQRADY